jgi:hypothetical protein
MSVEEEFDRAFAAKLAEFPVPEGLEARLLAIAGEPGGHAVPAGSIRSAGTRWFWPLAAAAAIAAAAVIVPAIIPDPVVFPSVAGQALGETYRDHMAFFASKRFGSTR